MARVMLILCAICPFIRKGLMQINIEMLLVLALFEIEEMVIF